MEEAQDEQDVWLEDPEYLTVEAALTAGTRGLDLSSPCTTVAPTLDFSIDGLSDALRTWSKSLSSTIDALAWSEGPERHLVKKNFMSLFVVKDIVTDGAAHIISTQWFHWDNPASIEGRITELDSQSGIIYRLSLNKIIAA